MKTTFGQVNWSYVVFECEDCEETYAVILMGDLEDLKCPYCFEDCLIIVEDECP